MEGLISADEPHLRFERLFEKSCFRSWPGALVPNHSIESESTRLSGRPDLATRDHGLAQILFDEASRNPGHSLAVTAFRKP
jgi:hypothetical protein